jgi:aminopeptidase
MSERMEQEFSRIANRILLGLNVVEGEHVLISGGTHQFDLLADIAVGVSNLGGHPRISVGNDRMKKRMAAEVPPQFLEKTLTPHDKYMAALYSAEISIDGILDEGIFHDLPRERMTLGMENNQILRELTKASKRRSIYMAWPSPLKAAKLGMTTEEFEALYLGALFADPEELNQLGEAVASIVRLGGKVEITSTKGSDLTFVLDPERRVMIDGGCYTPQMVKCGDITKNLPCGEVYTTPVEDSVNGIAIFDLVYVDGKPIVDLKLEFEKGQMVNASAQEGIKLFHKRFDPATGDKGLLGELGIGINPGMTSPIGHTMLDEKIYGSVHLALGESRMYGGQNASSIHWDLVMLEPSLTIGGKKVQSGGEFHCK